MPQDEKFTDDIQELIQEKQKQSAFVYVRNHLKLIERALHEGAKIADVYEILKKNNIKITLATLRLYLHRLRNPKTKTAKKSPKLTKKNQNQKQDNINVITRLQEVNRIKQQVPNLEELSKAFAKSKN
jgi:hypothetical protein